MADPVKVKVEEDITISLGSVVKVKNAPGQEQYTVKVAGKDAKGKPAKAKDAGVITTTRDKEGALTDVTPIELTGTGNHTVTVLGSAVTPLLKNHTGGSITVNGPLAADGGTFTAVASLSRLAQPKIDWPTAREKNKLVGIKEADSVVIVNQKTSKVGYTSRLKEGAASIKVGNPKNNLTAAVMPGSDATIVVNDPLGGAIFTLTGSDVADGKISAELTAKIDIIKKTAVNKTIDDIDRKIIPKPANVTIFKLPAHLPIEGGASEESGKSEKTDKKMAPVDPELKKLAGETVEAIKQMKMVRPGFTSGRNTIPEEKYRPFLDAFKKVEQTAKDVQAGKFKDESMASGALQKAVKDVHATINEINKDPIHRPYNQELIHGVDGKFKGFLELERDAENVKGKIDKVSQQVEKAIDPVAQKMMADANGGKKEDHAKLLAEFNRHQEKSGRTIS